MGWCSGTRVFDAIAKALLKDDNLDKKQTLKVVAEALREHDWDCERDSNYWNHPIVQDIFRELEPEWFEEEE